MNRQTTGLILLAILLASCLGLNFLFDSRMIRDIGSTTEQLAASGMSTAQADAVRGALLSVTRNVESYLQNTIFVIFFGLFLLMKFMTTKVGK